MEHGSLVLYGTPIDLPDQVRPAIKAPVNTPLLPERAPVTFVGPDTAVVVDSRTGMPTQLYFERTAEGRIGWFSIGGVLLIPRFDAHTQGAAQ
jgi:hypothetical protein